MSLDTAAVLDALKAALGPGGWTQDPEVIAPSLTEWRNRWTGHTPILLTPRSTEETAKAIAICAQSGVAVTPQGGGTGLVGGQIPFGEVLLSLKKMRAVRDVTPLPPLRSRMLTLLAFSAFPPRLGVSAVTPPRPAC